MKAINRQKIIIDTDPGHDDALALLLLLKANRFDIQAITTVAGNASIDNVTRNAQAIVNLIGADIPIYSGPSLPIERDLVTAVVHGESGMDGFDTSTTRYELTNNAPQKIAEIIKRYPGEVTVLTLGPLSNLARAFTLDPQLQKLIPCVVSMGGAIDVPGNKNRVAEFNFFVDPEAAEIVFNDSVQKVLVPLDICNKVVLQVDDFRKVTNKKLQGILIPMMEHFVAGLTTDEGTSGILVYDALAAYYLLNQEAFVLKSMNIVIETKGKHTRGMSVAERRGYKAVEPNTNVVMSMDSGTFKEDLFKYLNR